MRINVSASNVSLGYIIFKDFDQNINAEHIEIDNLSSAYMTSQMNISNNAYQYYPTQAQHNYINCNYSQAATTCTGWISLQSYSFVCSIAFNYLGIRGCNFSESVKGLPKIRNILDQKSVGSLQDDDTFSDFTFIVGGKSFKVHKNILSLASSVFKTMFTCGLNETKNNSAEVKCEPEIFQHLLTYIYKGILPFEKMPSISAELYELAHLYEIESLKKICLRFILDSKIDSDNALELYEIATRYDFKQLLDTSWEFIKM